MLRRITTWPANVPTLELEIGKPSNAQLAQLETNSEWYRSAPWSGWNPANVSAEQKEKVAFTVSRERESTDAFFDMAKLTADGKLDVDVYFGWDYHSEYHLKHSRSFFTYLKEQGFSTPVASWDAMTAQTVQFFSDGRRALSAGVKRSGGRWTIQRRWPACWRTPT